jgi:uncharacterized repeat protein (TIGR01451 family)
MNALLRIPPYRPHAPTARATGPWRPAIVAALLALACVAPARAQSSGAGLHLTNTPSLGADDQADDRYAPGTEVTYRIVVDNPGGPDLRGARITAALPADLAGARWTCRARGAARCGNDEGRGALDDTANLPAGSELVYLWTLDVPAGYPLAHDALDVQARLQLPDGLRATDPGRLDARDSDPAQNQAVLPAPETTAVPSPLEPMPSGRSSTLAGAAVGGLGAHTGQPGAVAFAAPFPACGPEMYISQGPNAQTNTTLSQLDTGTIPFTLDMIGTGGTPYNAIGFREADSLIYGIQIGTNRLVRVYADGSTTLLPAVTNLPNPPAQPQDNSYNAGEIGTDGYLYIKSQAAVSRIYKISLANVPTSATATVINLVGGTVSGADFAWIDDRLYTVNQNGTVAWINPSTGQVTTLPASNSQISGNVGALFGTPDALYGSHNSTGDFYSFDLTTGEATFLSGGPIVGTNDGAHCASAQIVLSTDVGVTKTNTPDQGQNDLPDDVFIPGTNVTYQILVSNRGPLGVAGLAVRDGLPAGISTASWTCQITQGDGNCDQASGSGAIDTTVDLEFDASAPEVAVAMFTLTVSVPLDFTQTHPALTNTVTIELPEGYVDPTPDDHVATDSDVPASANLRVVKQTPSTSVRVGDTIQYSLVADNLGPVDVANAILRDTANSHLDCLTPAAAPTCAATGSAVCPTAITRAALFGAGVAIPSLPANAGTVTVSLACVVTP